MKKRIAFLDFDGTITTRDSLLEIIKYQRGIFHFYLGFMVNLPFLIGYKIKLISNHSAKQHVLRYFFKGVVLAHFQGQCDRFATEKLPEILRPKAMDEIRRFQQGGVEVVIVSASVENWLKAWTSSMSLGLIATRLEIINDKITGRISGRNCYGEEKRRRITAAYDLAQYEEIYCYGDSGGDREMLSIATHSFYKPFR